MLDGYTAKQIGQKFNVSYRTIEAHYRKVKEKLQSKSKEDLIRIIKDSNIKDILLLDY
jgi:DNA-binding CsgD family transcriptional regulator